jgi:hypothetical protein
MANEPLTFKGKAIEWDNLKQEGLYYLPLIERNAIIEALKQLDGLKRQLHRLLNT